MHMPNPRQLFLCTLLALLAACGPAEQSDLEETAVAEVLPLEGTNWQLVQITVAGGFIFTPEDPGKYVLNFRSENRLTGTSDCNQISGSWQQAETVLRFEPFIAGRSLCPPGSLHNTLVLNLRDVAALEIRAGHLVLTNSTAGVEIEYASRD